MLKIRLQRVGRKHEPSFRVVLTDSKNSPRSGRFNEILGSYNPRKSDESLNTERIQYWLSQGANPTATVYNLLVKHQILRGKKIDVSAMSKKAPVSAPVEDSSGSDVSEKATDDNSPAVETQSNENGTIEPVVEEKTV